jgi:hypothetical protein
MCRFRITRRKLILLISGLLGLAIIIPVCVYVVAATLMVMSASDGNFSIGIAQDCNGISVQVAGQIEDANKKPVEGATVNMRRFPLYDDKNFSFALTTDKDGRFKYEKKLSIFICDAITFEVSARGFKNKTITYSIQDDHRDEDISTTNLNLINITITLERSS